MEKHLKRYIEAQENTYNEVPSEIKSGRMRSHWMWYVFPQYKGLGFSKNFKILFNSRLR